MRKLLIAALLAVSASAPQLNAQIRLNKDNIDEVVSAMTLEEKASMVVGYSKGAFTGYGNSILYVPGSAASTCRIDRLGIAPTVLADGPAGLRISPTREGDDQSYYCTAFPIGTALAASWSKELVFEVGKTIGDEVREYGVDVLLAPGMNLQRDPLCGRNFEYYSEDPLLSGNIAAAYVNGVQSEGVGTSVKHFAVNNAETNRKDNDSRVGVRALRELYLKGFEIAIKQSRPWTVMTSYNAINGVQAMESRELLQNLLRDEWGFDGYVMCDWAYAGLRNTVKELYAGNDLLTPGSEEQYLEVIEAVRNKTLPIEELDKCVKRILGIVVRTPRFNGYRYSDRPDLKAHAEVARRAAAESIVLLENHDSTLPLKSSSGNVGLFGISSYDFISGGTGSGSVNKAYMINLVDGFSAEGYSVNKELKDYYSAKVELALANLSTASTLGRISLNEVSIPAGLVKASAEKDDFAVITLGRSNGEGLDRHAFDDFSLKTVELNMINQVSNAFHAAGKKVIIVLNISGAMELEPLKSLADAVICCWLPGQEGGNAVMDVLSGRTSPSGKLPMSIPVSYFDTNTYENFPYDYTGPSAMGKYRMTPKPERKNVHYINYDEGIYIGYRHYDKAGKKLAYPFGYGLSYTKFEYSKARINAASNGFEASITVTNTGDAAGMEVVQLYVSAPEGGLDKPVKELKSFAKTELLAPGESQTLHFVVDNYDLASFNEQESRWETAAGKYQVQFASNATDIRETAEYRLRREECWKVERLFENK